MKAVFFDIDGTLVDSNEAHVTAWVRAFADHGHTIAAETIRPQIGKGGDLLVPALLPDASPRERKAMTDAHGAIFKRDFLDEVRPFPGARDLLVRAHYGGLTVVLASSASRAELEHYLKLLDARSLVDATTSIDDVGTSKPAPDIFAVALEKVAPIAAAEVRVVGDTIYDIEAAGKNGIPAIGLRSGYFDGDALRAAGAGAVFADAADPLANFDVLE